MKTRRLLVVGLLAVVCVASGYAVVRSRTLSQSSVAVKDATQALGSGRSEAARANLKWLLWFRPGHPEALRLTGLSYLSEKNYPAAIRHLSAVPPDASIHRHAHLELVAALLADYRIEQAEDILRTHLLRYPDEFFARTQLADLLMAQWRLEDARDCLIEHISDNSFHEVSIEQQLVVLHKLAKADFDPPPASSCIPLLLDAYDHHPAQLSVTLALGVCYVRSGQMERGRHFLNLASENRPQDAEVVLATAELLLQIGQPEAAKIRLDTLATATPRIQDSHHYNSAQAQVFERLGNAPHGLTFAVRALELQPHSREYHARVARLLQKNGDIDEARKYYTRSHMLARDELKIWKLTRSIPDIPEPEQCESTSDLYRQLGHTVQADAWQAVAARLRENVN